MSETANTAQTPFAPFERKMRDADANNAVIKAFSRNYALLHSGDTGKLTRDDIAPVESVPALEGLGDPAETRPDLLERVAIIKLNGGLGTSMGLERAKSIIPVREGLSFIDIIARQVRHTNDTRGVRIPLIFMNSFNTHDDTLEALEPYADLQSDIPFDFLQNKVPKVLAANLTPAESPSDPALEWCPPGHGDIYIAMRTSGVLARLLERGYEYAFVSNADNLGAVLDGRILEYMERERIDFLMEVAARTRADRKGGHLALLENGRLTLRESAQCPADEEEEFQNIERYRYFNTNTLWIHLPSLAALLDAHDDVLPLPLIRNEKRLDPRDATTPAVYQLETAMGAAISLFERSAAILVPRCRFAPVKTTSDLLAVRSDAYTLTDGFQVIPHPERSGPIPAVTLDPRYYQHIDQLEAAFPHGAPSLRQCETLQIDGPFVFGKGVAVHGNAHLENPSEHPRPVADGTVVRIP